MFGISREYNLHLRDILEAIGRIERYTRGMDYEESLADDLVQDGVVRNLMIIGEAKLTPKPLKYECADILWREIAGMQDILIHAYFGIHNEIVWDVVQNKIPELQAAVRRILDNEAA